MLKILAILSYVIFTIDFTVAQCPTFVTRATWGARAVTGVIPVLTVRPAPFLIIHQTGPVSQFCNTQAACSLQTRNTQSNHMDVYGYHDIAFGFTVGEDNLIYTGRGWVAQGQNLGPFANQSVNIAYIGNFDGRQPSLSSRNLLDSIIQCGITAGHLRSDVQLVASCQIQGTNCAANSIHGWVRTHPRYAENPVHV